jgi:hypothetical protein
VDPTTIKDIAVLETIKEGHTIFRRAPAPATAASAALEKGGERPCPHELVGKGSREAELSPEASGTLALLKGSAAGER